MSLAVEVTSVAIASQYDEEAGEGLERDIRIINQLLSNQELSEYQDPSPSVPPQYRGQIIGFSYSWIHYLRRVLAYHRTFETLTPVSEGEDASKDRILEEEYYMLDSHLICHSDAEGYYVPVDFSTPIYATNDLEIRGGILGSSYGLRRELIAIASAIGIDLNDHKLTDPMAEILRSEQDNMGHPYAIERQVWFTLFEAVTNSIAHGLLIKFC